MSSYVARVDENKNWRRNNNVCKYDKYYIGTPPQREVVFTGLNDNVDKKFLQEMCQKYGKVEHIKIYYDPLTKKHAGKAKVTFDLTKSAKLACTKLNSCSVMGNIITTQLEPNLKVNSFEPISPPPVTHKDSAVPDTALEGAPPLPPPIDTSASFLNYEDISPEQPPTPDASKTTKGPCLQESTKASSIKPQGRSSDESKITKMIESVRKDSGRHSPVKDHSKSPKGEKYTQEFRSHDQRHYNDYDDKRDKHRADRYTDYHYSRDYREEKEYSSRRDSKRTDRYTEHRSGYSRHYDSWKDSSCSDSYKSRKSDYSRGSYRDEYDKRHGDKTKDNSKYKRSDRYSTSPRRPEDRDRYAMSPNRSDDRRKPETNDSYGKEDSKSREWHGRRSPIELSSDTHSYGSTREEKRSVGMPRGSRSQSPGKACKSPVTSHSRKGPVSPPQSPVDTASSVYHTPNRNQEIDQALDDPPLPGPEQDQSITKQDVVRKRKLSNSTDDNDEKKTSSNKHQLSESEGENERYSPELLEDTMTSCKNMGLETMATEGSRNENSEVMNLPQVEDISPCPSPLGTVTVDAVVKSEDPSSVYSDIEVNDDTDMEAGKENKEQQDDDNMSLSSISSNEDTFELNEPSKKISPQPQHVTVPPPNMVFSFPPPMIPPPPMMFNPHMPPPLPFPLPHLPPPLPVVIPPPHMPPPTLAGASMPPLPPPIPPPNVLPPIVPVSAASFPTSYQHPGFRTQGFEYKPSKQEKYWNWKRQIIEVVSSKIHNELDAVLSRDVLRKLVELSAFKSLDAWWENQKKPKVSVKQQLHRRFFACTGDATKAYLAKKKRGRYDSESEHDAEVEISSHEGLKRQRTVSNFVDDNDDDRSQSPWQHIDDNMEAAPPATDVRVTKGIDRRTSTGSSLYKTIYSSESEDESESESEADSEDKDDSEESEEEESSEEDSEDEESEESEESEEDDEKKEFDAMDMKYGELKGIPDDIDMAAVSEENVLENDFENKRTFDLKSIKSTVETVTISQTTKFDTSMALPLLTDTIQEVDNKDKEPSVSSDIVSPVEKTIDEQLEQDGKPLDKTLDLEVQEITEHQEKTQNERLSIASLVELDHSYGLAPRDETPPIDVVGLDSKTPGKDIVITLVPCDLEKELVVKEKPLPIRKHLFPLRSIEQDDELVYEFLKSGIDYEDAYFLKVGFDQLIQVCSESVVAAKWSYHPDILTNVHLANDSTCFSFLFQK
ncbi:hypothetical protein QZH41_006203 [Actinostola sp. cb2023]|nr:hypothetical protein QZH41_006203 [Actinostola sp. cb2023]